MNPSVSVLLVTLTVAGLVHSATIPSDIKGCKRNDPNLNKCVIKSLNTLLPNFLNGDKEFALPVLDPFLIESLALSKRNGQGLDIAVDFKNIYVKGLKDAVIEDGSLIDPQKQLVEIKILIPTLTLDAFYNVDGKILLLPIKGAGDSNLTMDQLKVTFDADYTLHKGKGGREYAQLVNSKLDFTVEKFNIYLSNLFNGDKTLGDNMNIFLNENWQEVLKQFRPILQETIRTIVFTIVNNVAIRVPYEVLLPN